MINIYNEYIPEYIRKLTIYAREKAPMPVKKIASFVGLFVGSIINRRADKKGVKSFLRLLLATTNIKY